MEALRPGGPSHPRKESPMLDILLFALGLGLFGLMAAFARGCGRI
jgi:hypothetical protein